MNNSFWTVVGFTVANKVKGKAFLITTLIIALVICIGANLPYLIDKFSGESEPTKIGYLDNGSNGGTDADIIAMLQSYLAGQKEPELEIVAIADAGSADANESALKQAIIDEKIEGYMEFAKSDSSSFPAVTFKSEELMDMSTTQSLSAALQSVKMETVLKDSNMTAEQKKLLFEPVEIDSVQISTIEGAGSIGQGKSKSEQAMDMGLVYVILTLLFMAIMITGQLIASEITAEKSSRVMEVLITSVSPLKGMFGKIFGMFLVGLAQIIIFVAVMVGSLLLPHNADMMSELNINLADIDPLLVIYAVIFYLAGYFLYATMFAAVGSIVSRTEDLGQALMPITMLSFAGYYICLFGGIANPNAMFVKVTSYIPFFSPYVMLVRLGLEDPPLWQVWASILILLVTIGIVGWFAAKIYRVGVLMYGKRPSLKELRKAMRAYKV
ncbi:ABC transporter permease [Paenibacillus oenotherae]|uniref:ABC transporter permease n=1 Tax=Paenibacillus oenotherae TaxID=1435645 RepID=A0ABS7DAB7_9BACL|nr:ABC transporter permease [Paenibacillus oenotherae]MBW7476885.1 ABC transporter permease [Paenibacillus oenotherae]